MSEVQAEVIAPKRGRGRPRKIATPVVDAAEAAHDQDINIMHGVEADCPFDLSTNEGKDWCDKEFDKRKANVNGLAKKTKTKEEPEFSKEFTQEAKASDKRIDKSLRKGSENIYEAVVELLNSGDKGYYKALGFKSFDKYRESKSEYSRSHIGQALQVYKALHGKIPDEKFMALPMPTAVLLTKVPDSKLTEELVDKVSEMTIQEFKENEYPKLAGQLVDATTGEAQPVVTEEYAWITRMRVHQQVADHWKKLFEIARWKAAGLVDENDVYGNFSLDEKAVLAIYFECCKASGWESEYEDWQNKTLTVEPVETTQQEEAAF